jgi:hypothetical protein
MKISRMIGVLLWVVGICLASHLAAAAGVADGSVPLVCVPLSVTECGADDECQRGTAASINLPHRGPAAGHQPPDRLCLLPARHAAWPQTASAATISAGVDPVPPLSDPPLPGERRRQQAALA